MPHPGGFQRVRVFSIHKYKLQTHPRRKEVGAGDRSRTYTGVSPEDFESSASAIPPLRHVNILGQDSPVSNFISANGKLGRSRATPLAMHNLRCWHR